MPTSIAEFTGVAVSGSAYMPIPMAPPVKVTILSSAGSTSSNSTVQVSANTNFVAISGQVTFFCLFGSSAFTTTVSTVSSTSAEAFPGGMVHLRGVSPNMKIIGWSS